MLKLRITQPGHPDQFVTVERDWALLGRKKDRGVDVVIDQPFVSGRHALVLKGVVIIDRGSSNGTFVDGQRIEEPTLSRDGSFALGRDEVRIVVEDDSADRTSPAGARVPVVARSAADESADLRARLARLEAALRNAPSTTSRDDAVADRLRELETRVKEHESTIGRLRAELESVRGPSSATIVDPPAKREPPGTP